jgi:NADH:ubiquinone oxidoreductase subunit 5 (subunit L)/multisubunit Na+/H+ antiporter MnhA subunit
MVIVMTPEATAEDVARVVEKVESVGGEAFVSKGVVRTIQYPLAAEVDRFDRKVVDGAVNGAGSTARSLGGVLRYLQTGSVQRYAVFLFAGVVILAVIFTRVA